MRSATAAIAVEGPQLPDWIPAAVAAVGDSPAWLAERRRAGLEQFATVGFPGRRDEDWKYTDLRRVTRRSFAVPARVPAQAPVAIAGLECPTLLFVNGRFAASGGLPEGAAVQPLAKAIAGGHPACRELLGTIADPERHRFAALATALFTDGVLVDLAPGTTLPEPLRLVFLSGGGESPLLACPRVLVNAGANSAATLVEHYLPAPGVALELAVTELLLGPGARLEHYRLQEASVESFQLGVLAGRLYRDASLVSHNLAIGGRIARLDLDVQLDGPGARVEMNGLYVARDGQHHDSHTRVDHAVPHTTSEQLYRGVLSGKSRAVFNGKAIVHRGAAGTDARQSNANLLLSAGAEVDTKPELEIYADDVKCSHGATTGQLDESALFYLRSRGLDEETARSVLTFAFADTVLARMSLAALRRHAEQLVVGRLPDSERIREFR